jgi:integrase
VALDPGVVRALVAWKAARQARSSDLVAGAAPVFVNEDGGSIEDQHLADRLRARLVMAGVSRETFYESSGARRQIRAHDLRGTFVTLSLAAGRTESWVMDRTGHRSSMMIARYRRAARTVAELGLGELVPLDQAIPEFAEAVGPGLGPRRRPGHGVEDAASRKAKGFRCGARGGS